MAGTAFYGFRPYGAEASVSSRGVHSQPAKPKQFSDLTPRLLRQIPGLSGAQDVMDAIEVLPMHPISRGGRAVPVEGLTTALIGLGPDARASIVFVSERFQREELDADGERPNTLVKLLPFLRESIQTFGDQPVDDWGFAYRSQGTKSVRAYLEANFAGSGARPLSFNIECFILRDGAMEMVRAIFPLGQLIDENSPGGFQDFNT